MTELHDKFAKAIGNNAEYLGKHEDGSEEWHSLRRLGIGASSIGSVMGMSSAFKSAVEYWADWTGKTVEDSASPERQEMFDWGHLLEEPIASKFVKKFSQFQQFDTGTWRNRNHDFMVVNCDRILYDEERDRFCVLEIKTSTRGTGWDAGLPPLNYIAQVRYQLAAVGLDEGYLSVLIHGNKQQSYRIFLDADKPITNMDTGEQLYERTITKDAMVACCTGFLNCVKMDKPPQIDGSVSAWQTVKQLTLTRDDGSIYEIEDSKAKRLIELKRESENLDYQFKELRNNVMHEMSTANYLGYRDDSGKLIKIATRKKIRGNAYTLSITAK